MIDASTMRKHSISILSDGLRPGAFGTVACRLDRTASEPPAGGIGSASGAAAPSPTMLPDPTDSAGFRLPRAPAIPRRAPPAPRRTPRECADGTGRPRPVRRVTAPLARDAADDR